MKNKLDYNKKLIPPLVTTIIPTFRRPRMLKRAIQSVLDQKIAGLNICVFDNDSGDETSLIIRSFIENKKIIHYHKHNRNIGAADNFEFGLKSVNTPYFSILSDDDYLLPGFYQAAIDELSKNPQALFWAGITLNVDEKNIIWDAKVDRWQRDGIFNPPDGLMRVMSGMAPTWTGIVFRREALEKIGLLDKETLGPSDLDFILKIAAKHQYIVRKLPAAVFTLNDSSFSHLQPLSSFWPGWKKMLLNLELSVQNYDDITRQKAMTTLHKDAKKMLFRRGANALAMGRLDFARDAANELNKNYSKNIKAQILKISATICEKSRYSQQFYTMVYRFVEKRIIAKRREFKNKYQHLIRPL